MRGRNTANTSANMFRGQKEIVPVEELSQNDLYAQQRKMAKRQNLTHLYKNDYKPAKYALAIQYRDALSYKKKLSNGSYKQLDLFEDTEELKVFGLGPYFFIEYQRRMVWLFFVLSLMIGLLIYLNFNGQGLQDYGTSISAYLFKSTLGNYDRNVLTEFDSYFQAGIPGLVFLAFFIFYLIWVGHYSKCISEEEENSEYVKPEKFCVEVEGFQRLQNVKEEDLEYFFHSFGPIYEVSMIRQFEGKLSYFEDLDNLEQQIKQEELEIILGSGDQDTLRSLKKQKDELNKYIHTLRIKPTIIAAYVHFQFQKSKADMLNYFNDHYLFSNAGHAFNRSLCCCCIDDPEPKYLFKGEKLYIKNEKVPEPEDINWENHQIGCCSKFCRVLFGCLIFLIFLAISCTIIGMCSLYISANSVDCTGIIVPKTVADAELQGITGDQKKCFCYEKLIDLINNTEAQTFCDSEITEISTEQGIQYAIIGTSGIVNFLFGLIVSKIVNFTQPQSHSSGYMWKTALYTCFMIFNTVFLPLLIYADIFGFTASTYISFVTLISEDIRNFFQVESISFNEDFLPIWYRNVSPIFTNYVIIDGVFTFLFFILYKCISNKDLASEQGTILQKHMNEKITSWKLNAFVEYSYFNLIVFICVFFCCGIPVLIPLGMINLLLKYIANRSLLQNNSSKIEGLSEKFNSFPHSLIPIMLVLSALVGEWMLTGNSLIYDEKVLSVTIDLQSDFNLLNRQLFIPWFIILAILVLFYFLFYNLVVRFCSWLSGTCYEKKQVRQSYRTMEYSHYAKSMSMLSSYNMRNNPKFKNIIINLEKYLDQQQKF